MNIALSIIIPMYNAEKYIGRCLNSIFQQGMDPQIYEIHVMNDGSTDRSTKIVQDFIDKGYPIALHSHDNIGADASRNKGFKYATGDFIYLMDADDYLAYDCFNAMLQKGLKDNLQIVSFQALATSEDSNFTVNDKPQDLPEPEITTGKEYLRTHRNARFESWWYFVNRTFLEQTGIRFVADNACSDTYYTLEHFLKAERIVHYPVEVYRYFAAPTSLTRHKDDGKFLRRMFNDFSKTSIGFSEILLNLKEEDQDIDPQLWDNLTHRRDGYVFYYISLMLKSELSKKEIHRRLEELREKEAYPIKNYLGPEYTSLKWKVSNYIFNHESLLTNVAPIYRRLKT